MELVMIKISSWLKKNMNPKPMLRTEYGMNTMEARQIAKRARRARRFRLIILFLQWIGILEIKHPEPKTPTMENPTPDRPWYFCCLCGNNLMSLSIEYWDYIEIDSKKKPICNRCIKKIKAFRNPAEEYNEIS
jgi:hypothetical protein